MMDNPKLLKNFDEEIGESVTLGDNKKGRIVGRGTLTNEIISIKIRERTKT